MRAATAKLLLIFATALLALAVLAPGASSITVIDWVTVSLEEENVQVPVTIPCGGERVGLRGTLSVHVRMGDDGSLGYTVNVENAVGTDASSGATYRVVGAGSGDLRAGESITVVLFLVGEPDRPVPVEVRFRTAAREGSSFPQISLASIRAVQSCDPGTITLSDAGFGGFGDYKVALVGTALEPSTLIYIYGIRSRGGVPYETVLLGDATVQASGTFGGLIYPTCSDGLFLYATGTSASGYPVTSNTYVSPC
jgi:hypothetical protein